MALIFYKMTNKNKLFKWLKAISIFAIIWNLLGVGAYLMHTYISDEAIALLPESEKMLYSNIPTWYTVAFAIAVFGGFIGSVLLFFKKKLAISVLMLSLIGVFVQMYYNFFKSNSMEVYGPGSLVMPILVILFAIFLVGYARALNSNGYLS